MKELVLAACACAVTANLMCCVIRDGRYDLAMGGLLMINLFAVAIASIYLIMKVSM